MFIINELVLVIIFLIFDIRFYKVWTREEECGFLNAKVLKSNAYQEIIKWIV